MQFADALLLVFAAAGHVVLWVALYNRLHSLGIPRWAIRAGTVACWTGLLAIPLAVYPHLSLGVKAQRLEQFGPSWPYAVLCFSLAVYGLGRRIYELLHRFDRAAVLLSDRDTPVNLLDRLEQRPTSGISANLLTRLPGNEALRIHLHEKMIQPPRLAPALDRISIAHLSDLHMCGQLTKEFFREVVELTNALEPDLIAVTGDVFDSNDCLPWTAETLGHLRARYGVYFVLGNHDLRIDSARVRETLTDAGLIDLGGRRFELMIDRERVLLAGNEVPWFPPPPDMTGIPRGAGSDRPTKILLSHAPDQFHWARAMDFDLMLAGHTHGGQIRLPVVGPVIAPSWHGTRYTAGTFYLEPTVMHVSRGISGTTPLRYSCPPEITKIVLRSGMIAEAERASAQFVHAAG